MSDMYTSVKIEMVDSSPGESKLHNKTKLG